MCHGDCNNAGYLISVCGNGIRIGDIGSMYRHHRLPLASVKCRQAASLDQERAKVLLKRPGNPLLGAACHSGPCGVSPMGVCHYNIVGGPESLAPFGPQGVGLQLSRHGVWNVVIGRPRNRQSRIGHITTAAINIRSPAVGAGSKAWTGGSKHGAIAESGRFDTAWLSASEAGGSGPWGWVGRHTLMSRLEIFSVAMLAALDVRR